MSEKANFTGSAVGAATAMTGRLTSIAADTTGLIVVGAASGGLWLSTNNGTSFASVFDNEPTQSIGAIALDTTTTPSTIYVGTGEGNGSIDSLYGSGMFKSSGFGPTLDLGRRDRNIRSCIVYLTCHRYHDHSGFAPPLRRHDQRV